MKNCDELYISYLFPPSNEVSGITVFKRIVENNNVVDVLQGDFKSDDSQLSKYVNEFTNDRFYIQIDEKFDCLVFIDKFIKKGLNAINKDYKKIYSRSWAMANHFLASEYKFTRSNTFWTAEFSDPLIFDLNNKPKTYKNMIIKNQEYISKLNNKIKIFNENTGNNFSYIEDNSSAYFIAEYLVYLFADKVIFTNENQRKIMLNQFPIDVKNLVLNKSEVRMHPTLPNKYYQIIESNLKLDDNYINIAYFGKDYYSKRHFESLFYAVGALNHKFKDRINVYLYLSEEKLLDRVLPSDNFIIKKPIDYLEFLNVTTKYDVLIVNDMNTNDNFELNPYLPSKLSDYLGSGRDIWALYEDRSVLSEFNLKYKSNINDYDACLTQLVKILDDYGFKDENYSINQNYLNNRLTFFNELYENEYNSKRDLKRKVKKLKKENKEFKSSNIGKISKALRNLIK